ncbi:hypothetical protein [Bacillus velezensis]|uniref:hypothetical protein n=1 Tax=Bacillus velezensis TaxID=492670 RepID=UPI003C6CDB60
MIKQEKKVRKEMRADSDEYKRDNAIISVYDDGKYIQRFISQKKVLASLLLKKPFFQSKNQYQFGAGFNMIQSLFVLLIFLIASLIKDFL